MGVWNFLARLLHRFLGGGRAIVERSDGDNEAAVSMHKQAAKLHEIGAHNAAAQKGSDAETSGHRATQSARDASGAETDAKRQSDLDSGRLYLGD